MHAPALEVLVAPTPAGWAQAALADFGAFLVDHASCERKAVAHCFSLVVKYSDRPLLTETMATLAREELDHFQQVYRILQKRGLRLGGDDKDPYVNEVLHRGVRHHLPNERLLDRLLIAGVIEARGCERFDLIADALPACGEPPEMVEFYRELARAEAGHYRVFVRVAEKLWPDTDVAAALARLAAIESEVMLASPWRSALH